MILVVGMPFCPKCEFEYREGVERCPECGSLLVEKLEKKHDDLRPEVPLTKLAEGARPMVEMLADILRGSGIQSVVKPSGPAWGLEWPAASPLAEIWLRSDDLEQHSAFIQEEAQRMGDHVIWFYRFDQ
jgi:hypothetical protein